MKVAVVGLGHLGCVTVAGLTKMQVCRVSAWDRVASRFQIDEPGISGDDVSRFMARSPKEAIPDADVVWITYDTPVDSDDDADPSYVACRIRRLFPHLEDGQIVLISSQVPVGFTRRMQAEYDAGYAGRSVRFLCSPENVQRGKGLETFTKQERIVVGGDSSAAGAICDLLYPLCSYVQWMSLESAEMTKHALNAFLAMSIAFSNEIGHICEQVGANPAEVEIGLKTDIRIGKRAYLRAGEPFTGGTLGRDLRYLRQWAHPKSLIHAVWDSNQRELEGAESHVLAGR